MTTIRHRIIRGYMLVLGLALTGSTAGLLVGNHLQKRAIALQEITIAERKLLSDLQVKILYNRPTKQLSPHLGNSAQFNKAGQAMIARVSSIQTLVKEHENIHQARARLNAGDISSEQQALYDQIEAYEQTLKIFRDRIQTFIQSVDDAYAQGEELEEAQQLLIDFVQSREFADFVQFPEELHAFVTIAEAEEIAAAQALKQAFALQTQIILSSLLLSSAIATLVALITSRVIAQPVQTVTAIARRVTDENNFDLQAPIEGKDEVSSLAQSLNQLIRKVKQLLSQLGQKNTDLEAALTQLNKQQIQLVQSEKMSSLGHLVAGIAHEINNPVNFIHGNLRHLKSHTQDLIEVITLYQQHCPNTDDTLQEAIEDIDLDFIQSDMSKMLGSMKMGTERIRQIVLSLRNFSRMDEAGFKTVNIHEGINSTLALLQNQLEATDNAPAIQVTQTYDELPLVECSAGHLNQVFMNILTNAIDALRSGPGTSGPDINPQNKEQSSQPHITIRTSIIQPPIAIPSKSSASASASETGEWLETKWVQIEIADNGPGMTEAVQKSMFEPFFTTKPVGQGNGLGMSLSYQIITDRHHGKLECASTPGQGTTLKIQLPCHQHKTVRILAESMAPQVMKTQSMASAKA